MSRLLTAMAAIAALLLSAGCGGSNSPSADDASSTGSESQAATPASSTEAAAAGKVNTRYDDAQTPDAEQGRGLMMDAELLEAVAAQVNDTVVRRMSPTSSRLSCCWPPGQTERPIPMASASRPTRRRTGG
ncbi:hypothetical protein MMRN_26940 [Mycobacterium marinum]|nr:hypothetical protein MMRN_26940 [Mycobacterium marinum]